MFNARPNHETISDREHMCYTISGVNNNTSQIIWSQVGYSGAWSINLTVQSECSLDTNE